jgi:hypothetical protein
MIPLTKRKPYSGVMPPQKAVIKSYFEIQDKSIVDGDQWYTVQVNPRVSPWIKEQNKEFWFNHLTPNHYKVLDTFDIHEKIYTMMALRWS